MGMPLRNKTPAAPAAATTTRQTPDPEAPLPDTPEQGSAGDGSQFIPPPPVTPNGTYRMRFVKVNTWEKSDGTIALNSKTGEPSIPVLVFEVSDPKEAEKNKRGLPSCYGEEVTLRLDFTGRWYAQTAKHLTDLGVGPSTASSPPGAPVQRRTPSRSEKPASRERVKARIRISA